MGVKVYVTTHEPLSNGEYEEFRGFIQLQQLLCKKNVKAKEFILRKLMKSKSKQPRLVFVRLV